MGLFRRCSRGHAKSSTYSDDNGESNKSSLSYDVVSSCCLLLLLYTLQGIPMGLGGSIPMMLKETGASYEALSMFQMVSLPFSLKIIWAPFVDTYYVKSFGRRKSWLVPIQLLCGVVMISVCGSLGDWLGTDSTDISGGEPKGPQIMTLTGFFMLLYFMMATQDIAVDGWALTMLPPAAVGYAATCNNVGQMFGYFLSNQLLIILSDPVRCHKYLGTAEGEPLVTLPFFMLFFGWVFIIVTVLVSVFKAENNDNTAVTGNSPDEELNMKSGLKNDSDEDCADDGDETLSLADTLRQCMQVISLKPVQTMAFVLMTVRVSFAAADACNSYKLQEYGMTKEDLASVAPITLVMSLVLPPLFGEAVVRRPIDGVLFGFRMKIVVCVLLWLLFEYLAITHQTDSTNVNLFFGLFIFLSICQLAASTLMFLGFFGFFSMVADPVIGGTYMTFLATLSNLGCLWPNTVALYVLPKLTFMSCSMADVVDSGVRGSVSLFSCYQYATTSVMKNDLNISIDLDATTDNITECSNQGGTCGIGLDGYTILTAMCAAYGVMWYWYNRRALLNCQNLPKSAWSAPVVGTNPTTAFTHSKNMDD